jgi:hypothetical protein
MQTLTTRMRRRGGLAAVAAAAAMLLTAAAPGAGAVEGPVQNHREVPNNACEAATPPAPFVDRDQAPEVHHRSIDCVAAQEIAEGDGTGHYRPQEAVTRAQMASFVARMIEAAGGELPAPSDQGFDDIAGNEHEDRINQLAEVGVVEGRDASTYDPSGHVTRGQMASYLVRAASFYHQHPYVAAGDDAYFLDIEGSAHRGTIRAGYELVLFEGVEPGSYGPSGHVVRSTMATFLTRTLDLIHPTGTMSGNETYNVFPSDAQGVTPGEPVELEVTGRTDHRPITQALHLVLFPCTDVDLDPPRTFVDAAGDALADGYGASDTGQAYIRDVNGEPVEGQETAVANAAVQDGAISFTLIAPAADCTVVVVFDDRGPADALRLDALGRPANAFGYSEVSWG